MLQKLKNSPYFAFFEISFKRQFAYRIANWAGLFTNLFFLFFKVAILEACYTHKTTISNYTILDTLTYVTVMQGLIMVVPMWGRIGVGESIRSGKIATDLIRPVNFFVMMISMRLGVSIYYLLVRTLPIIFVGYLVNFMIIPHIWNLPVVLLSIIMSAIIGNCLYFLIESTSFWLESDLGPRYILMGFSGLMAGLIVPIAFFPDWALFISKFLPFAYMLSCPVEIFLGKHSGMGLCVKLLIQLFWVVFLIGLSLIILKTGVRKMVLHGG